MGIDPYFFQFYTHLFVSFLCAIEGCLCTECLETHEFALHQCSFLSNSVGAKGSVGSSVLSARREVQLYVVDLVATGKLTAPRLCLR